MAEVPAPLPSQEQSKQDVLQSARAILDIKTIPAQGNLASYQALDTGTEVTADEIKEQTVFATNSETMQKMSLVELFREPSGLIGFANQVLPPSELSTLGIESATEGQAPELTPQQKLKLIEALITNSASPAFQNRLKITIPAEKDIKTEWVIAAMQQAAVDEATAFLETDKGEKKPIRRNKVYSIMRPTKDGLILEGDDVTTVTRTLHLGTETKQLDFDTAEILTLLNLGITQPDQYGPVASKILTRITTVYPNAPLVAQFKDKYETIVNKIKAGEEVDPAELGELTAQLTGDALKDRDKNFLGSVISTGGEKVEVPDIAKTIREDLLGAQQLINSLVPTEDLKVINDLEVKLQSASGADKDSIAQEIIQKRQTFYKALLCAYNVQPTLAKDDGYTVDAEGKIEFSDEERALAEKIKTRGQEVIQYQGLDYDATKEQRTTRRDKLSVIDANKISAIDMLYEYGLDRTTMDKLKDYNTWTILQMERNSTNGTDDAFDKVLQDDLGIDPQGENFAAVRRVIVDRLNTDLRLREMDFKDKERQKIFEDISGGTNVENLSLSETQYLYMGLKGVDLLLRRSMYEPPVELKNTKIRLMQPVQGPGADASLQSVMDRLAGFDGEGDETAPPPEKTPTEKLNDLFSEVKTLVEKGELIADTENGIPTVEELNQRFEIIAGSTEIRKLLHDKLKTDGLFKVADDKTIEIDGQTVALPKPKEVTSADYFDTIKLIDDGLHRLALGEISEDDATKFKQGLVYIEHLTAGTQVPLKEQTRAALAKVRHLLNPPEKIQPNPEGWVEADTTITRHKIQPEGWTEADTSHEDSETEAQRLKKLVERTELDISAGTFTTAEQARTLNTQMQQGRFQTGTLSTYLAEVSSIPVEQNKVTIGDTEVPIPEEVILGHALTQLRRVAAERAVELNPDKKFPLNGPEIRSDNLLPHLKAIILSTQLPKDEQTRAAVAITEHTLRGNQDAKINLLTQTVQSHLRSGTLAEFLNRKDQGLQAGFSDSIEEAIGESGIRLETLDRVVDERKLPIDSKTHTVIINGQSLPIVQQLSRTHIEDLLIQLNAKGEEIFGSVTTQVTLPSEHPNFNNALAYTDRIIAGTFATTDKEIEDERVRAAYTLAKAYLDAENVLSVTQPLPPVRPATTTPSLTGATTSNAPTVLHTGSVAPSDSGTIFDGRDTPTTDDDKDGTSNATMEALIDEQPLPPTTVKEPAPIIATPSPITTADHGPTIAPRETQATHRQIPINEIGGAEKVNVTITPTETPLSSLELAIATYEDKADEAHNALVAAQAEMIKDPKETKLLCKTVGAKNLSEAEAMYARMLKLQETRNTTAQDIYDMPQTQEYLRLKAGDKFVPTRTLAPSLFFMDIPAPTPGAIQRVNLLNDSAGLTTAKFEVVDRDGQPTEFVPSSELLKYVFGSSTNTTDYDPLRDLYSTNHELATLSTRKDHLDKLHHHAEAQRKRDIQHKRELRAREKAAELRTKAEGLLAETHANLTPPRVIESPPREPQSGSEMVTQVLNGSTPFSEVMAKKDQGLLSAVLEATFNAEDKSTRERVLKDVLEILNDDYETISEGNRKDTLVAEEQKSRVIEVLHLLAKNQKNVINIVADIVHVPNFEQTLADFLRTETGSFKDPARIELNILNKNRIVQLLSLIALSPNSARPIISHLLEQDGPLSQSLRFIASEDYLRSLSVDEGNRAAAQQTAELVTDMLRNLGLPAERVQDTMPPSVQRRKERKVAPARIENLGQRINIRPDKLIDTSGDNVESLPQEPITSQGTVPLSQPLATPTVSMAVPEPVITSEAVAPTVIEVQNTPPELTVEAPASSLTHHEEFASIVDTLKGYLTNMDSHRVAELVAHLSAPPRNPEDQGREWKRYALAEGLYELSATEPKLVIQALRNGQLLTGLDYILQSRASDLRGEAQEHNIYAKGSVIDIFMTIAAQERLRPQLVFILNNNQTMLEELARLGEINIDSNAFGTKELNDEVLQTQRRVKLLLEFLKIPKPSIEQEKSPNTSPITIQELNTRIGQWLNPKLGDKHLEIITRHQAEIRRIKNQMSPTEWTKWVKDFTSSERFVNSPKKVEILEMMRNL